MHRCISLCIESYASVRVIVASVVIGSPERMSLTYNFLRGLELRARGGVLVAVHMTVSADTNSESAHKQHSEYSSGIDTHHASCMQ